MAVLMADLELGVAEVGQVEDAAGYKIPGVLGAVRGPWPGRARQRGDGSWALALDSQAWPVRRDDVVVEVGGAERRWTVVSAEARLNTVAGDADYVAVEAALREEGCDGGSTP